jgi:cytidine deaminase
MKTAMNSKDKSLMFAELDKIYKDKLTKNKPHFEPQEWYEIANKYNFDKQSFLFECLDFVKNYSQPVISGYKVGAIGIGKSGNLYFGVNIEFLGFPLNQSIHAEQSLICNAYYQNEEEVSEIYISAFPCGHCRQFFRELKNYKTLKIFSQTQPNKEFSMEDLLPHSFGPEDLNVTKSLFENKNNLQNIEKIKFINLLKQLPANIELQLKLSLEKSFCPYTKNQSAVIFEFIDKSLIAGSYIESCAYNPSFSPFHMTYSQLILLEKKVSNLSKIYIAELQNNKTSQMNTIKSLCKKTLPKIDILECYFEML